MAESPLEAFVRGDRPVSIVRAEDLRRVWSMFASQPPQTGVAMEILADLCAPNADVFAVWFRASLIEVLLRHGRLHRWRSGSGFEDKVFEVAAAFPLAGGATGMDPDGFVAAIEQSCS